MLTRHPWLVQAFGSFPVFGPGKARHDDHSLAVYEAAGFTGARADQAASTVFTFVLGNALGPAAAASLTRKLGRDGGDAEERLRDSMAKAGEIASAVPTVGARLGTASADYVRGARQQLRVRPASHPRRAGSQARQGASRRECPPFGRPGARCHPTVIQSRLTARSATPSGPSGVTSNAGKVCPRE